MDAATAYAERTGRRVTYEMVMIDGINDTPADAAAAAALLRGRLAHVNLIPMNPVAHTPVAPLADASASRPSRPTLRAAGLHTTVRRNRGIEIGAACGQLAADRAGEPAPAAVHRRRELLEQRSASALARSGRRLSVPRGDGAATARPPLVAASILNADFSRLDRVVHKLERAGVDRLHLDVMDGHFVDNLTFGPDIVAAFRRLTTLPARRPPDDRGAVALRATASSTPAPRRSPSTWRRPSHADVHASTLRTIRDAGRERRPGRQPGDGDRRPCDRTLELLDIIMIMTVEPGWGGQGFLPDAAAEDRARRASCSTRPAGVASSTSTAASTATPPRSSAAMGSTSASSARRCSSADVMPPMRSRSSESASLAGRSRRP